MNQVKIKIDGYEIECNEGESILNTARANDLFPLFVTLLRVLLLWLVKCVWWKLMGREFMLVMLK